MKPLVYVLLLLFTVACSRITIEERFIRAQQLVDQGDYAAAVIEYKNIVLEQPSNESARFELGKLQMVQGMFAEAEKEFTRATELGYPSEKVSPLLVKAIFYQNDYLRVQNLVEEFPEFTDAEANSSVALFNYLSQIKSVERQETIEPVPAEQLVGDDLLLAQAYQALLSGSPLNALQITENFTNQEHERFEKLLFRGNANSVLRNHEQAIEDYRQALAIHDNYYLARFLLTEQLVRNKDLQLAKNELDLLLEINPNSGYANYLKAEILFYQENYEEAISAAEIALSSGARVPLASFVAGLSAYNIGRLESALRYFSSAANALPPAHPSHRWLAQVRLELGYVEEVIEGIDGLNLSDEQNAALYSAAALKNLNLGDQDKAQQFIEQATRLAPDNPQNILRRGLIELEANQQNSAIDSLTQALQAAPELAEGWRLLAEAKLQQEGIESALEVAKEWQKTEPVKGLLLEGFMHLRTANEVEARTAFEKALELDPEDLGALRFLMINYARFDELAKALEFGEKLIELSPDNLQNLVDVMNLQIGTNHPDVEEFLKDRIAKYPDLQAPKAALAMYYNHLDSPDKSIELLEQIEEKNHFSTFMVLGDSHINIGEFDEAASVYREWAETYPGDSRAWTRLIVTLNMLSDLPQALQVTKRAQDNFPNSVNFRLFEATILTNMGQVDAADRVLAALADRNDIDQNDDYKQIKGTVEINKNNFSRALPLLQENYNNRPSFYTARLLAIALAGVDRLDEGLTLMEEELANVDNDYIERHVLAEFAVENKRSDFAMKQYDHLISVAPNDFPTLNNKANLLMQQGRFEQALPVARQALDSAPQSAYALDTYGIILFRMGNIAEASQYVSQALARDASNVEIRLHMAEILIAQQQNARARELLMNISPINAYQRDKLRELQQQLGS